MLITMVLISVVGQHTSLAWDSVRSGFEGTGPRWPSQSIRHVSTHELPSGNGNCPEMCCGEFCKESRDVKAMNCNACHVDQ